MCLQLQKYHCWCVCIMFVCWCCTKLSNIAPALCPVFCIRNTDLRSCQAHSTPDLQGSSQVGFSNTQDEFSCLFSRAHRPLFLSSYPWICPLKWKQNRNYYCLLFLFGSSRTQFQTGNWIWFDFIDQTQILLEFCFPLSLSWEIVLVICA